MYDIEKLRTLLISEEYRTVNEIGQCFPPSNEVFKRISNVLDGNPSSKHVYTIVKNNRNSLYEAIVNAFEIKNISVQVNGDYSFDPNASSAIYRDKFDISLTFDEWKKIEPVKTTYENGRNYLTLQSGWTDLLAEKIWIQYQIPCPWTFKNIKETAVTYIRIKAQCPECNAKLYCTLIGKVTESKDVIFKCAIKNAGFKYIHNKRRQLRGRRRVQVANAIIDNKIDAITYVRNESKKIINFGDVYPPILPKTNVLRKAVNEVRDKRLGLTGSKVLNNLVNAMHTTHVGLIHKIGLYPFSCYYWTKEQILAYKISHNDDHSFIAIDATGSVCKRIKYEHNKSKHIFLYLCMIVTSNGSMPIFQMVSAEQDTVAITTWLLKILSCNIPLPRMVVCDFSQAILSSVSKVFTDKRNLREYMQTCFDILKGNSTTLPSTYIRLDISHIVAIVCRWDCLKRCSLVKVRQFFIRSICHAYQMQSLQELEHFIECILTVALSQTLGSSFKQELQSQISFNFVKDVIKGIADFSEPDAQCSTIDEVDLNTECCTGWIEWSRAI